MGVTEFPVFGFPTVYPIDMSSDSKIDDARVDQAIAGDVGAMTELFDEHRSRLRRMIELRMDRRLKGRVDPSDVLQEAYVDLAKQLPNYAAKPAIPFFIWLRRITGQRLSMTHRHHLGAAKRNAGIEVGIFKSMPEASSVFLASQLVGQLTTVSQVVLRDERQSKLMTILEELDEDEREIIALRHFEHLSVSEIAAHYEVSEAAAGMRHLRALRKMKKLLSQHTNYFDSIADFGQDR